MKYKPDQIQTHEIKDATLEKGKFSKKVVHVAAGAPAATDDTGLGYEQGSIWIDSSNGDMYICSDHSAEDAVWRNMEGDDVNPPFVIQGSSYGYHYQCEDGVNPPPDVMNRFSLTSSGNATDIGELADIGSYTSRGSTRNTTHNYYVGLSGGPPGAGAHKSNIWRFPFTAPSSSADVGEHSLAPTYAPQSPSSIGQAAGACDGVSGWVMGGEVAPPTLYIDHIDKFTMASPAPSADSGAELTAQRIGGAGASDIVGGQMFISGGFEAPGPSGYINFIEQAPFSISTGTTSDWGDTVAVTAFSGGTQSTTHGYVQGGAPGASDQISKYSFSSPGNVTDVGNLTDSKALVAGCSSTTHGYRMGGQPAVNTIDNYPYSSDDDASDVGDLTLAVQGGAGAEI